MKTFQRHVLYRRRGSPFRDRGFMLAFGCACCVAPIVVQAATVTWTGAANDGDWNHAGNWNPVGVPALADTANIPGGLTNLYPRIDHSVVITVVKVNSAGSGASVTVVSGGTFDVRGALTVNAGGLFAQTGGTSLLSGGLSVSGGAEQSGGVMHFGSNAATAPGGKLAIKAGGTVAQSGGTMSIRDLDSASGSTFSQSGNGLLRVFHDYKNRGTFDATGGTIEFAGTGGGKNWDTGTATGIHRFFHVVIDAGVKETFDGKTTPTIHVRGGWTNNGLATLTGRVTTVVFDGTNDQDIAGASATAFRNLTIDKAGGALTMKIDATVGTSAAGSGTLALQQGTITTGPNTLTIYAGGSVSRPGGTPGHVIGNLRKFINANGAVSRTYEVGTSTNYTPIEVAIFGVSGAGTGDETLTGSSTAGDHPALAGSGINAARSVNRYWTLLKAGSWNFSSNDIVFHFVPGDIDAGANFLLFEVRRYSGGSWTAANVGARSATSIQATSLTGYGDFAVGETNATAAATLTALASSPNPACPGVDVAFTATVTSAGSPVTTGMVRFIEGGACDSPGVVLAGPYAVDANGQAGFVATNFSAGSHVIVACYTEGVEFDASQGSVTQVVHAAPVCFINGSTSDCPNSVELYTGPAGMSSYEWSIAGNAKLSGPTNGASVNVQAGNVCNGSFTLTLDVSDTNGCATSCNVLVPVADTVAPILLGVPSDTTVPCGSVPGPPIVTAADNCDATVQVVFAESFVGTCAAVITRTWTAADTCGNSIVRTQIVNVVDPTFRVENFSRSPSNQVIVWWSSVSNAIYRVSATTNFVAYSSVASGITGVPPLNGYTTAPPTGAVRQIYRIELQ